MKGIGSAPIVRLFPFEAKNQMQYAWKYGAASATADYADGLCTIHLRGLLTNNVLDALRRDVRNPNRPQAFVYVICWTRAALAVSLDNLGDLMRDAVPNDPFRMPVVNVVTAENAPAFQRYALRTIEFGIIRVTTLSLDAALAWAQRKAVVSQWSAELRASETLPVAPWRRPDRSRGRRGSVRA